MRKFYLKPGQAPPAGTTSHAMPDGGIVWQGDKWTWPDIESHEMDAAEQAEYARYLKYQRQPTEFRIDFTDFASDAALATRKAALIVSINAVSANATVPQ
jgi:hypothetical protein